MTLEHISLAVVDVIRQKPLNEFHAATHDGTNDCEMLLASRPADWD
jgi:hypothetical protein